MCKHTPVWGSDDNLWQKINKVKTVLGYGDIKEHLLYFKVRKPKTLKV